MDEINEGRRTIRWSKRHNGVGPLNAINALKGKFFSARKCNGQLMKTQGQIEHPHLSSYAKLIIYRRITPRNRVWDDSSDTIEWDVVNAETPNKVFNITDCFLMRFWRK